MHWVQALITSETTLAEARKLFSSLVICPLPQGLALTPMTRQAEEALETSEMSALDPPQPLAPDMASGVAALAARLSLRGPVVYAATFLHGGTGGQQALVWMDGALVLNLQDDDDDPSHWPNSPISRALRHIGVKAPEGKDEFDAIGFGHHRSNEAWARAFLKT